MTQHAHSHTAITKKISNLSLPQEALVAAQHERRLDHACHPTFFFARHGVALQLFTCRRRSIGLDPRSDGYLASLEPLYTSQISRDLAMGKFFARCARVQLPRPLHKGQVL